MTMSTAAKKASTKASPEITTKRKSDSQPKMEAKEQTVIISLDDAKDNQENYYNGGGNNHNHNFNNGGGGGSNRDTGGYRRKNFYYNSHRYRQGHNPHHYNNGYNNSYNNGYNNHYNNHSHSNYGGGRNYGSNDHKHYYSYPPNDHQHHNHSHGHVHCHNDNRAPHYEPYQAPHYEPYQHQHNHRDGLSEQIWAKFQSNQQTLETFRRKWELWRDLTHCVRKYNSSFHLEMVGSTLSGFGSNSSDVDMCLILNHQNDTDPRAEAIEILENLCPLFESSISNLTKTELILAKVPILKLKDRGREIDIDINVNNAVGLRNTHLLHAYAEADWRVRPLVLVVKLWAHIQGINNAKLMTLSSYSLTLMVIHYLQVVVTPEILPCLQVDYPERYTQIAHLWRDRKMIVDPITLAKSENSQSLGELLLGFLEYFAIKFESSAISVRTGSVMSIKACALNRAIKNDAYQWKHICIEEPFEFTNTARSVYDKEAFDRIRGVFMASWQRLLVTRNIESIFQTINPVEARRIGIRVDSVNI